MNLQRQPLVDRWHDPDAWTTGRVPPSRQFDYWREFVIDAHMHWAIRPLKCDSFPAFVRQGRFDGFRVTHLTAPRGGVVGTRGRREIARDGEAFYNLIYILEGSIGLVIDGREVPLTPGTFALWDTTRPMTFVTGKGLRQITLCVPQNQLQRMLPRADDFVGCRVAADTGVSRLFADHLQSLDTRFGELPESDAGHVLGATTELLASALSARIQRPMQGRSLALLEEVMTYMRRHLEDPDLTPRQVAYASGISERHLHRLFAQADSTPAGWLRRQRLDRSRRELCAAGSAHLTITDIAYRWGFRDSATFSKMFKREYGVCPRELRAAASHGH